MERVRLRLELDRPETPRAPGDVVTGALHVELDEDCECRRLTVAPGWETGGRGTGSGEAGPAQVLPAGAWKGGDRLAFPLSLVIPAGPPGYEGTLFSVRWFVRAEATLRGAADPSAEVPLRVVLRPPQGEGALLQREETGCLETGCATVLALVPAVGLPLMLAGGARGFVRFGAWAVGIASGLAALWAVPRAIASRRLGHAILEVGPSPVPRGAELACRVVLQPRRDLTVGPLRVRLVATETASIPSGDSRKTLTEEVVKSEAVLEGPTALARGRPAEFAGMIPVPAGAPPTFQAGTCSVKWGLTLVVPLSFLPDVEWQVEVGVT